MTSATPSTETLTFAHWRDVPPAAWPWANFAPREMACKGTGQLRLQRRAIEALQALRQDIGKPMLITSAYRSPSHNQRVGGAPDSRHMMGDAFDVQMAGHDPAAFEAAARRHGFKGFGYYPRSKPPFMHIDLGPARVWGERFVVGGGAPAPAAPIVVPPPAAPPHPALSESDRLNEAQLEQIRRPRSHG